jgi:hypothetical protein
MNLTNLKFWDSLQCFYLKKGKFIYLFNYLRKQAQKYKNLVQFQFSIINQDYLNQFLKENM